MRRSKTIQKLAPTVMDAEMRVNFTFRHRLHNKLAAEVTEVTITVVNSPSYQRPSETCAPITSWCRTSHVVAAGGLLAWRLAACNSN